MEPSAYLNDPAVLNMGTLARGAYSTLLLALWDLPEPGVVPGTDEALRALSRTTPEEWAQVRDSVGLAFDTESRPGFWVQKRMLDTHTRQDRFIRLQKARGRAGGKNNARNKLLAVATQALTPDGSQSSVLGSRFSVKDEKIKIVRAARTPFTKPALEEVQAYCRERKNAVDPTRFLDHYESNGWKVGRNAMKDWRAAIRTWERNDMGQAPIVAQNGSNAATGASRLEAARAEAHKWAVATGRAKE